MGYGIEGICEHCGTVGSYCTVEVALPLPCEKHAIYYCPACSTVVRIPVAVENRFLADLAELQSDHNGSWFRSQLATLLKGFADPTRPYALMRIPPLAIKCPEHELEMKSWTDYPEPRALICQNCGQLSREFDKIAWISGSVITPW